MAGHWTVLVVVLTLIESISNEESSQENLEMKEFPLSKSLGYSIKKTFGKTLEDARLNQEYLYQFEEALKASQELSSESYEDQAEKKLRGLDKGSPDRRRHSERLKSAAGVRRSRSQALRRQKLNSQSLKSHQRYSKQNKITNN